MNKEQLKRILRERLREVRIPGEYESLARVPIPQAARSAIASALAPWIIERIEEARCEERMDAGRLP